MRAVVAHGPGDFRVAEADDPSGTVVEVEAAGVCAADRMLWTGAHPWGELAWPFTPGHELLGRVVSSDRDDLPVGTRVTAEVKLPCRSCPTCVRGDEHLCPHGAHLGSGFPGAFAERLALPAGLAVHVVPESLSTDQAVLAEPMACAVHAVARTGVRPGDHVAIAGLGGLGALAVVAARAAGAAYVVAVVRSDDKARLALSLGYDAAVLAPDDAAFDAVLDVSGSVDAVAVLLRAVRPGGRVGVYGVYDRPLPLDLNALAEFGELSVAGGHLAPGCFPTALALLAGVDGDLVVSGRHPLETISDALTAAHPRRLKEIVCPT
ncbi:MAG: alcohol dehydrogenase catalytic domain-containing protein [Mycobacteriales bacterium]|nr:alcohol dehydrogenase catalytic domain-containing protein [Mycobacteriales bacterium]